MELEMEILNFIFIWISAIASSCYCYFIPKRLPSGRARLLSLLPVILLFIALPLALTLVHLAVPTFFSLVWLANFKLLLFAFNRGPLSTPAMPLLHFLAISLLPIILKHPNRLSPQPPPTFIFALKSLLLALVVWLYKFDDGEYFDHNVMLVIYSCHLYLAIVASFFVSGLMHELLFYYVTRATPKWGLTWFFTLHGVCVAAEVVVIKKKVLLVGGWRLNRAVSGVLTLGFLVVTAGILYFPQLTRSGIMDKIIDEYFILLRLVKDN